MRAFLARYDRVLYVLWAAAWTLACARQFYGYMMMQTGGEWSAPLDDVFIHFDYARAAAEGHPFEWFAGNGYSSGNTSLLYPFVLAAGYVVGFRGELLMKWAAIVAMTSTFIVLWLARDFVLRSLAPHKLERPKDVARITSYLIPPMFLALGALDWSLWSGMEVAFFLGVWAITLAAFFGFEDARDDVTRARWGWALGISGFFLVVTRPEGATTIAGFGVAAALTPGIPKIRSRIATLFRAGAPAATVLVVQSLANRALTGESSAAGAIVKLAINNPFLSPDEKLADYTQNLHYAIFRNLEYHFTDWVFVDSIVPVLALLALSVRETRRYAALLLWQVVSWMGSSRSTDKCAGKTSATRCPPSRGSSCAPRSARARSSARARAPRCSSDPSPSRWARISSRSRFARTTRSPSSASRGRSPSRAARV